MERIKLDFKGLFKEFINTSTVTIGEDVIQNSDTISDEVKKELMDILKRTENFAENNTGIPKSLKVNHKKAIKETLEQNPIKVDPKTGEIIKKQDEEIERE